MAGTLIVCAGPIGNLSDAPPRLGEALGSADVVFAEDTRRVQVLLGRLGVRAVTRSYFVGNEERRAGELRDRLSAGETVALVTDAGTPGISDPGLSAVRIAVEVGAAVTGVPGPSAVTLALALSGFSADRFVFEGFLPRKAAERRDRVAVIASELRTVVFLASPNRIGTDLADLAAAGSADRACAVCREMTKIHEEIWRGSLGEAAEHWAEGARGEVTVVLDAQQAPPPDLEAAVAETKGLIAGGTPASDAVRRVATGRGVSRRALYERVVRQD
ncbi:MAG: 16S rRNA (cytidine(1402)-2'-O)-methyltransferase [Actinobacteria bacterium RBG_16_68_21]|nr:MAG: 16S rRNA (cytidine(1402)-2'-O)-methyltransferase [Actinobacteria bacterium RBG_16_68_21]